MADEALAQLIAENERLRSDVARLRAGRRDPASEALASDLATAIQGLPLLLFLLDAEDRYVDFRAGRAADLYVSPESFIGKRIDEVMPRPLGGIFRELTARVRAEGKELLREYHLDMPSGRQEFEARIVPLAAGRVAMLVTDVPDLWCVRCDPAQLQQVVLNLVVNARDAMPRGGKLTLETANEVLDEAYAREHGGVALGPHVLIAVSDSGEGMTEEARAHVFEPFFTTKPAGQGTGLGLATVYGIVRQSGGHVWVYSERGRGTTFKMYFPRAEGVPEPRPQAPGTTPRPSGGETVLVVEDDPQVREVTVRALRGGGYRVLDAADGRSALRMADAADPPIRLLVTDVVMPELSGREVADALQRRIPGAADPLRLRVHAEHHRAPRRPRLRDRVPLEAVRARRAARARARGAGRPTRLPHRGAFPLAVAMASPRTWGSATAPGSLCHGGGMPGRPICVTLPRSAALDRPTRLAIVFLAVDRTAKEAAIAEPSQCQTRMQDRPA